MWWGKEKKESFLGHMEWVGGWPLPSTRRPENKHHHQDKEFNEKFIINYIGQWVFVKLPSFLPWFFLSSLPTTPTPNKSIHTTHPSIYWRCITCYRNIIISAALLRVITITGSHSLSPSCNLTPPHNCRGESAKDKNGDSQQFPFDIRSWFVVADDMVGVHRMSSPPIL